MSHMEGGRCGGGGGWGEVLGVRQGGGVIVVWEGLI